MRRITFQRGFTLVELVMVIVIMGVIGSTVAVFMKGPIDAYFASGRRAALTDVADTALRRITRDIRKALPNSVRVPTTTPPNQCLEFIPTKTGGRYRAVVDSAGNGDILDFSLADTSFEMFGANSTIADQAIGAGDVIAVYNLGPGINDAYAADNTATVSGVSAGNPATITLHAGKQFPQASGGARFHVIPKSENVVAYVCNGGKLYRTASTTFTSACPATGAILASNLGSCSFVYNGSDLQRNGLVQLSLQLTDGGESVNLYHEVHVDNTP